MIGKVTFLMLAALIYCECVSGAYIYSSFWAPLFNPKILNYKVDAKFDPDAGKNNKEIYQKNYGYRGQDLIADLGNGKRPNSIDEKDESYGEVKFYYTYPGAIQGEVDNK